MLQDVIKNGTSTYRGQIGGLSASGLIWPVSGPLVSPFGPRWGRLHAGIDIAIAAGNPIYAAAAGVVTHAGWMGGYGNMVIVQHANGLASGYAHQSQIHVSNGQLVGQGFEGIHIFDISNPEAPTFVRGLRLAATGNPEGSPTGSDWTL